MPPVASPKRFATAKVTSDILLDSRRALVHPGQGWLAVADIHYGYESVRRQQGALLPHWGMTQCEATLRDLVKDHRPRRLILVGDIMDAKSCAKDTAAMLDRIAPLVEQIVCILGNHDRAALKKAWSFVDTHQEDSFHFSHGHKWDTTTLNTAAAGAGTKNEAGTPITHITGHLHPSYLFSDGAGLRLKVPVLVQEQINPATQRWTLPAFSPWAAGTSVAHTRNHLALWACAPTRVWRVD